MLLIRVFVLQQIIIYSIIFGLLLCITFGAFIFNRFRITQKQNTIIQSQKKLVEMEATLRLVIALAPNNQHAYNALGYSFADRNINLNEALMLIEKALHIAPDDPFILDSFGWVKYRLGQFEEAEQALRRAYQFRSDPEIAIHLGEVLWSAGKKDEARQLWREVDRKYPENEALKSTLARLNGAL